MDKKRKPLRFIKNRTWKSKFSGRLKGRPDDVCEAFINGQIDYTAVTPPTKFMPRTSGANR
jgi:hypothetical protein